MLILKKYKFLIFLLPFFIGFHAVQSSSVFSFEINTSKIQKTAFENSCNDLVIEASHQHAIQHVEIPIVLLNESEEESLDNSDFLKKSSSACLASANYLDQIYASLELFIRDLNSKISLCKKPGRYIQFQVFRI